MKKTYLLLYAIISLLPFGTIYSNVLFVQEISPGNYVEVDSSEFNRYFPLSNERMQQAFQGYQRAQELANQISSKKNQSPLSLFAPMQRKDPLIISLDNSDWAYNEMYGKQIQVSLKSGHTFSRDSAPITRIGRNMPHLNNKPFMGEVLAHETGHAVMNALFQGKGMPHCSGGEHNHDSIKDPQFAMVEGFAEYYAASTFGDSQIPRSYKDRNRDQLNSSEGFVASVLLAIHDKYGQDAIFETFANDRPVSLGQFVESFIQAKPDSMDDLLEIMREHSGKQWPLDSFIKALKEGTLTSFDLDGDGILFPPKEKEPEVLESELAQIRLNELQEKLNFAKDYQKELLEDLQRWRFLRDYLMGNFSKSAWRDRLELKINSSQNTTLLLYENSRENILQIESDLERARQDHLYWQSDDSGLLPTIDNNSGGSLIRPLLEN